jgi:predicted nucleic acid-binding protein
MVTVVDASVAMAWCFDDESTDQADAILELGAAGGMAVPAVWPLEVANVVLGARRRGRLSEAQASRFLGLLAQLPIEVELPTAGIADLVALGMLHGLSSYDAAYLALAETRGATLATLDHSLAAAARAAGVTVLP